MTTTTENLGLKLYDRTLDSNKKFIDFRDDLMGTSESNMKKIDNFAGEVTTELPKKANITYVDDQIASLVEIGVPKLQVYFLSVTATTEGQTVFDINLDTFDNNTDTVLVQSGRTMLFPGEDFNVSGKTVVLTEGVPNGRTIGIYVAKNIPIGEDGSTSGNVIAKNTLPVDRIIDGVSKTEVYNRLAEITAQATETTALANGVKQYKALSELSANESTSLLVVFAAMTVPSRLACDITAGSTNVYPAATGVLMITKTSANTGTATFVYDDGRIATASFTESTSSGGKSE